MATQHYPTLITRLILEGPRCLDCLAVKCNLAPTDVADVLETIGKALEVRQGPGECAACGDEAAPVWSFA